MLAPILVEAPKRAVKFASNEEYTQLYRAVVPNLVNGRPQLLSILTGVSAGLTEALVVVSFELVKIRMQDRRNAGLYLNTMDCVKKVWRLEGPLGFFRGLEATLWRHAAWNGAYFGVIQAIRSQLPVAKVRQP